MAGIGDFFGGFGRWFSSGLVWFIIAIVLTVGVITLLFYIKKKKLKYNVKEIISYGNGKIGMNKMRAGIFKKKTAVFGLWDYGAENVFKTSDGRIILEAQTDDLHDIEGRKGFILRRKDDDPKILVPINKISWKGYESVFNIAPADYRDASVNIIDSATKETQGWADKYLPYLMLGGMVIFFIVGFILASQFFNRTVDKAGEILVKVSENRGVAVASGAP
tara:strand:+ start:108 stop:767 length:660 start_codon:yes stop_codon:yes gene_type:complete